MWRELSGSRRSLPDHRAKSSASLTGFLQDLARVRRGIERRWAPPRRRPRFLLRPPCSCSCRRRRAHARTPRPILAPVRGALVTGAGRGSRARDRARARGPRAGGARHRRRRRRRERRRRRSSASTAFASTLDVRDAEACRAAAASTAERAGSLDVWVNNAGILVTGHVWEQDEETRRLLFDVNALGTINGTLAALEPMRPAGRGHVINVDLPGGARGAAGRGALRGDQARRDRVHARRARRPATRGDSRRPRLGGVPGRDLDADAGRQDRRPRRGSLVLGRRCCAPRTSRRASPRCSTAPAPCSTIPRWRGAFVRMFDAFPGLAARIMPLWFARRAGDGSDAGRSGSMRAEGRERGTPAPRRSCALPFMAAVVVPAILIAVSGRGQRRLGAGDRRSRCCP